MDSGRAWRDQRQWRKAAQGDGVIVVGESELKIKAEEPGEILLFDLE